LCLIKKNENKSISKVLTERKYSYKQRAFNVI